MRRLLREPWLWIAALSLLAAGFGFLREQAVAAKLGLSIQSDAVYTAVALASVLPGLVGNALSQVLASYYARVTRDQGEVAGRHALAQLVTLGVLLAAGGALLLAGGIAWAPLLLPGRNLAKLHLALDLTWLLALAVPGMVYVSGAQGALALLGQPLRATAVGLLLPLTSALVVWWLHPSPYVVIESFLLGYALQVLVTWRWLRALGLSWMRPPDAKWVRRALRDLGQAASGGLALTLAGSYIQGLAAMQGATEMASFNFGTKFPFALQGLATTFLSTVLCPLLVRRAAGLPYSARRLRILLGLTVAGSVIVTLVLVGGADVLLRWLLRHGAFSEHDVQVVARIQTLAALQLPFYLLALVVSKALLAQHQLAYLNKASWVYAGVVLLAAPFLKGPCGVGGLLLASGLGYVAMSGVLWRGYRYLTHPRSR